MDIAVGIPTKGRSAPLRRCLQTLGKQTTPIDHLVLGDQNPDDTANSVVGDIRQEFHEDLQITVLDRPENETLPGTRNAILDTVNEDVLCYLDDDTGVHHLWCESIIDGYSHPIGPAAVGGPCISTGDDGEPTVDILRTDENQNRVNRYGEIETKWQKWVPSKPIETDLLSGGNMSFCIDSLRSVNGFDSEYGPNPAGEEFVPMLELRNRGDSILYHPNAIAKHYDASHGGSSEHYPHESSHYYWTGRHQIRRNWKHFRETFWLSLIRLFVWTEYVPAPAWKLVAGAILSRNLSPLYLISGYVDGLRYERS